MVTQLRASLFHGFSTIAALAILVQLLGGPAGSATSSRRPAHPAQRVIYLACLWRCGLVASATPRPRGPLPAGSRVAEILAAADRVLAVAGETVGACPRSVGLSLPMAGRVNGD